MTPRELLLDVLAHTSSDYLDENFATDEELGNIADYLLKRCREENLREAADFLRDAHFRDGMTVQEIGVALRYMADEETNR
ncbi:hypothetical protein AB0B30_32635 [Streptomyces narbonensis]|uniref:CdiI immunity protein domain-containing protein n=1 Tax=Streptomyces narbonensis TaxID=67333 RepID=A0ABV3CIV6_9ACTN